MPDFAQRACTGYTSLLRAPAKSYLDRKNAVLGDAQSRGAYLARYRIHVGNDGHSRHVNEDDSNKARGSTIPRPHCNRDFVEVPFPAVPLYLIV